MFDYKQRPPSKELDENWDNIKWDNESQDRVEEPKEDNDDSNRLTR